MGAPIECEHVDAEERRHHPAHHDRPCLLPTFYQHGRSSQTARPTGCSRRPVAGALAQPERHAAPARGRRIRLPPEGRGRCGTGLPPRWTDDGRAPASRPTAASSTAVDVASLRSLVNELKADPRRVRRLDSSRPASPHFDVQRLTPSGRSTRAWAPPRCWPRPARSSSPDLRARLLASATKHRQESDRLQVAATERLQPGAAGRRGVTPQDRPLPARAGRFRTASVSEPARQGSAR